VGAVPVRDRRFGRARYGVSRETRHGHLERQRGVASFSLTSRHTGEPCLLGLRHFILSTLFWLGAGIDSYD
jgi:hypothetical protein